MEDLGINYYFSIKIDVKKNWFGIISIILIGAIEFVGGCALKTLLGNYFGLMSEGINDIKYGIECLLTDKSFSWEEVGNRKLAFLMNLAVNLTVSFITQGFKIKINKPNESLKDMKDMVKQGAFAVGKYAIKEFGKYAIEKTFGEKLIKEVIQKTKDFFEKISLSFFREKIRDTIMDSKIFEQMINIDKIMGNNYWEKQIKNKIINLTKSLKGIIRLISNSIIQIIKDLLSDDNWGMKIKNIFANLGRGLLEGLKNGVTEALENLKGNLFYIFTQFSQRIFKEGAMGFNDILGSKLFIEDKNEVQQLIRILYQNNLIDDKGIINGKLLYNDSLYQPKNYIPLPIDINNFKMSNNKGNIFSQTLESINLMVSNTKFNYKNEIEEANDIKKDFDKFVNSCSNNNQLLLDNINDNLDIIVKKTKTIIGSINKYKSLLNKCSFNQEIESFIQDNTNNIFNHIETGIKDKIKLIRRNRDNIQENINEMGALFESIKKTYDQKKQIVEKISEKINSFTQNEEVTLSENELERTNLDSLDELDFGQFSNIKGRVIQKLKDIEKNIDSFDLAKLKKEIIIKIENCFINCISDIFLDSLQSTELGRFIKSINGKTESILNEVQDKL